MIICVKMFPSLNILGFSKNNMMNKDEACEAFAQEPFEWE